MRGNDFPCSVQAAYSLPLPQELLPVLSFQALPVQVYSLQAAARSEMPAARSEMSAVQTGVQLQVQGEKSVLSAVLLQV